MPCVSWLALQSSAASLAPVPRGSKPTMSYCWLRLAYSESAVSRTKSTPEAPGPPGVGEQRAEPLAGAGGDLADQRHVVDGAPGSAVVERHRRRGALEAGV